MKPLLLFASSIAIFAFFSTEKVRAEEGNCKEPMSNLEMTFCAGQEFVRVDRVLNQTYRNVLAQNAGEVALIRISQRAWLDYRDKECAVISNQWRGGSGQSLAVTSCKIELTNERIARMRKNYLGED